MLICGLPATSWAQVLADLAFDGDPPKAPADAVLEAVDANRYGEDIVYATLPNGSLWQEQLVRDGTALAYGTRAHGHTAELLALPVAPHFAVDQEDAAAHMGQFRAVSGRVHGVKVNRADAYVNFSEDWKTDFTIYIPKATLKRLRRTPSPLPLREGVGGGVNTIPPTLTLGLEKSMDIHRFLVLQALKGGGNIELAELAGKTIRVRGYIHRYYGPRITLHEPMMLEVLDAGNE